MKPKTYTNPEYPYRRVADQDASAPVRHPVVIVGAGPVGLGASIDLAQRGVSNIVLDDSNTVSVGSRAICFAKRTLEIFDRLGIGDRAVAKGVTWNTGRVFFGDREVHNFDLLPETGHKRPAFINLQQYYVEQFMVERLAELPAAEVRWRHKLVAIDVGEAEATLTVETPEGRYTILADHVLAADGAKSFIRQSMGLDYTGKVFQDRFLIADVVMKADFPSERWFWFDPPFNPDRSALLHQQPDGVWRIDLQLGWEADPEEEKKPENVRPRIERMLGPDVPFDLEWISIYTFTSRRIERFRHGPVFFVGDSAHLVSPFGARGANSGVQDIDNLGWKLAAVLHGKADARLLDTYEDERIPAADENIRHSTRSTDFIVPDPGAGRAFRDGVLELAEVAPFAKAMINSGRLSKPSHYPFSPTVSEDALAGGAPFAAAAAPGSPALDAPVRRGGDRADSWLLDHLGAGFTLLFMDQGDKGAALCRALETGESAATADPAALDGLLMWRVVPAEQAGEVSSHGCLIDTQGFLAQRYDLRPGSWILIRPDQHVLARGRQLDAAAIQAARQRALGPAGVTRRAASLEAAE